MREPQRYARGELVIVIDCADLDRAGRFWSAALGYEAAPEAGPGPYRQLLPADGAGIEVLLQQVPEPKAGKNRLHLDLRAPDLDSEVERVTGLGAVRLTARPVAEGGWRWHVLADPDGNEFCVLQPPRGRQHDQPAAEPPPGQRAGRA